MFCEKPIATELTSTIQAVEAARAAGVKLQIGFQRRFAPDWAEARARIKDGELGQIYFLRICHCDRVLPSVDYLEQSGGFFLDATIHDLDMARWMVDEIDEVTAIGAALSEQHVAELGDVDNALVGRPRPMRIDLPLGTVTFLFTDQGSTRRLHELGAEA